MRLISHSLTPELILSGIISLIGVGNLSTPRPFSALPPVNIFEASPKAISGRTSYIRVRLEFLRYPQVIRQLFNGGRFGPPLSFTSTSTCSWIGHPVSGLLHVTIRAVHPRFPCGSVSETLNLATYNNSPDRSTKSTISHLNVLYVLVNIRFQVLFHSPPGVLFTVPSRYCTLSVTRSYLALRDGPRSFTPDFTCPALLWISLGLLCISTTGLLPCFA